MSHRNTSAFLFALILSSTSLRALASSITYSDSLVSVPTSSAREFTLPKFNPDLGALQAIDLMITTHVSGDARYESLDAIARNITVNLAAQISVERPDGVSISTSVPLATMTNLAAPFDGVIDFAGTSGYSYANLYASAALPPISLPVDSNASLFIGAGNVTLPVIATAKSFGSAGGNAIFSFRTLAGAAATLRYTYAATPEPGTLSLALLGAMMLRRRRCGSH